MSNNQGQKMMKVTNSGEERLIVHGAHASGQFNDETEANLLNCFRELAIGQVGCDINVHAAMSVYSDKVEEVDTIRACRKINRGMSSLSNRDIS